jgi:hypothetical protein
VAEWHLAPFIGQTFGSSTTLLDLEQATDKAHWHFGGSITLIGEGPLGAEALFLFTPSFFQRPSSTPGLVQVSSSSQMALMGNLVVAAPRNWNEYGLRPFLSGGLGMLRSSADEETQLLPIRLTGAGYNIGGGAVGFLSNRTGLRFDLRYFRLQPKEFELAVENTARLSFWTASVGVVIRP